MILLLAICFGLVAGWLRARAGCIRYQAPPLKYSWLVVASMLPQGMVVYLPRVREITPDWAVKVLLIVSLVGLLVFIWLNKKLPGLYVLGAGLVLNLLVISMNGGLMPISPETVAQLTPEHSAEVWQSGDRLGWSKDIILTRANTRLWWLSDHFLTPAWFQHRIAFSPGDVLIALGAFWFLWAQGAPPTIRTRDTCILQRL